MIEDIISEEFVKLPLDERSKLWLKDYSVGEDMKYQVDKNIIVEIMDYLEKNEYMALVGGNPKSGPRYAITEKGLDFIAD